MKRLSLMISVLLVSFVILSCGSAKKAENMRSEQKSFSPGPKAIIYQTKEDYSKLVPIILSADKKTIESYPDVKDVYFNGSLAYPTQLHKGFWLDNRGINANVVFINLTYEAYSKLPKTPSPEELIKMVGDTQPIISMYTCGPRSSFQDIVKELNTMIDSDDFSTFIKIK